MDRRGAGGRERIPRRRSRTARLDALIPGEPEMIAVAAFDAVLRPTM
jgi:hypothetical protein